jgi:hypothetical protein
MKSPVGGEKFRQTLANLHALIRDEIYSTCWVRSELIWMPLDGEDGQLHLGQATRIADDTCIYGSVAYVRDCHLPT